MAFTGTPALQKLGNNKFRIAGGITLAGDASGTIGFSDKSVAAEVSLPAPNWQPYSVGAGSAATVNVTLIEAIQVDITVQTDVTSAVPISVVKTGTTHADFVITLHNDSAATVSGELEIWIEYGGI